MQITHVSQNQNNLKSSFGQLNFYAGEKIFLQNFVDKNDRYLVENMIKSQKNNPVDVMIFSNLQTNRLEALIIPKNIKYKIVEYSQKFYQSTVSFLEKSVRKAENLNSKIYNSSNNR